MWFLIPIITIATILILNICLNSVFSFKKFNLIIWRNKNNIRTVRYVFDGWTDIKKKNTYHGSVLFLMEEANADRTAPSLKKGGIYRMTTDKPELDSTGMQTGSIVEIQYTDTKNNIEMFENLFNAFGIAFHRADPFYKPTKTLKQLIKTVLIRQK